ncbi:MAG TPA: SET domain-containing protein [Bacteriovoracaceae bacterium]|nr:SET domain-containing protein [Bacteriovoracaceae bacterium]
MMLVRSSVKYSSIHGLGCFADQDIKKGELVWKLNPRIDLEFDLKTIETFPEITRDFLKMYSYGQESGASKTYILCGDHARHMNHSKSPNLSEENGCNIAVRDIKAGEELTCDYTLFDADSDSKLHA